jgi:hypothetical protein
VLWNGAHLAVLSAFALAQPVFDILGQNPEFFAVRGSSAFEIVLFALVITFALPAALLAIELVAGLVSRRLSQSLHLLFVGGLVAIVALRVVTKTAALTGTTALLASAAAGIAGAALYWRASAVRTFMSVLTPAPVVFLLLFLVGSPVSKLVFTQTADAKTFAVKARTPVVLIVFDEFSTASLVDRSGRIDARRWPSFASLAHDSTWFRAATTVHAHTNHAVPAILDGKLPEAGNLPILADHPQNLFTFLGGSYELRVVESQTHLCPPKLCGGSKARQFDPGADDETGSLASDVGIVYLHLLLPDPYAKDLPPISNTWGNFGGSEQTDSETTQSTGKPTSSVPACGRNICRFASLIEADRKPSLYFLHSLLPHVPWLYLPSGKHYGGDVRVIPGTEDGSWPSDRWLVTQGLQRYLLQLGYTDRALGIVLRRLRATGLYDRALVIVTADHGETFRPGSPRRTVTRANLADIAFVPLFVKVPGQKRGRIDDSYASNIDILPTIADVLGARVPWQIDGESLLDGKQLEDATVSVPAASGRPVTAPLSTLRAERAREERELHAVFGSGSLDHVYRIGPQQELLGKSVLTLNVRPSSRSRVELSEREVLQVVDLSTTLVPNYVTGAITPGPAESENLAIAVNGTVRAVTRTYTESGATRFAALVPESSMRSGVNDVAVFAIHRSGRKLVLEELRSSNLTFALAESTAPVITASDGTAIRVESGALAGDVRALTQGDRVSFSGWAADLEARRPADSIVIFVDGRSVYAGHPGNMRRDDVEKRYGVDKSGFLFMFPRSLVPARGTAHQVRVFALRGDVASELEYKPGYPWATGR